MSTSAFERCTLFPFSLTGLTVGEGGDRIEHMEPTQKLKFAQVVVEVPVAGAFSYAVPSELQSRIQAGQRVLVPFGARRLAGYVVALVDRLEMDGQGGALALKAIEAILDEEPFLSPGLLALSSWMAQYYLTPWGEVFRAMLPRGLALTGIVEEVYLTQKGREGVDPTTSSVQSNPLLQLLQRRDGLRKDRIGQALGTKRVLPLLSPLLREGLVETRARVRRMEERGITHVVLHRSQKGPEETLAGVSDPMGRGTTPVQARILHLLQQAGGELPLAELKRQVQGAESACRRMLQKGMIVFQKRPRQIDPVPLTGLAGQGTLPLRLTEQQQEALVAIEEALAAGGFQPFLLHGVTGSGKTEVYLQATAKVLAMGKAGIVLVPEISLTPLIVERFYARFGDQVAVLHSALPRVERCQQWRRIHGGGAMVVIGARSAIFAPVRRLGLIVVDEEHDASYKQEEAPRYHARDVALMRGKLEGAVVVLGSATPSLDSFHHAMVHKYRYLQLPSRVQDRALPRLEIVDLRRQGRSAGGRQLILSERLRSAMAACLGKGQQVLLFLNRRGFATFLQCSECGFALRCPNCSVALVLHYAQGQMRCHLCNWNQQPPQTCPQCGGYKLQRFGIGTERVEQEIALAFPGARLGRLDRDVAPGHRGQVNLLHRLARREIDVLIGTQMIVKGHDFPNITLVGVICADTSLNIPDFRSGERTFQILTQVAGRAGRGEQWGEVIIQSFNPEHYSIQMARAQDQQAFYRQELVYRQQLAYPPFTRLVAISVEGLEAAVVERRVVTLSQILRRLCGRKGDPVILGPAPAVRARIKRRYRQQILLKGVQIGRLHAVVRQGLDEFAGMMSARRKGVQVIVDVDPVNLL